MAADEVDALPSCPATSRASYVPRASLGMIRSPRDMLSVLASDGPGGTLARRLLPAAAGVLALLGYLRWEGEQLGLYGTRTGLALFAVSAVVVLFVLVLYFGRWLDRHDAARREAEVQSRHTARYFGLSRDLLCTAGFDGRFKDLNGAWTQALGWSEDELLSRAYVEFVHPDDRERTEAEAAKLAAGGVSTDFVNRYATKEGGWRWLEWSARVAPGEDLIYASARDISDRKRGEASLEASERQTRRILETAPEAFISIDEQGAVTYWNPQAETVFGWSCEEVLGRELAEIIIPERYREAHRAGIERFLACGEGPVLGKPLELSAVHRDGHEFPVELTLSALETDAGHSFNGFLHDITERKRSRDELARARDQALEATKQKSEFLANMSHEIRTPMNGVIGMTGLLLETDLDREQREYAETVRASGEALLTIINDILDFSKIEAGRLELEVVDFELPTVVEEVAGLLAERAHAKGLELATSIRPELPAAVRGDPGRLRQVLTNLVGNAIKFTDAGEVVVRAELADETADGPVARFAVSDTGIGIAPEAQSRLFEAFAQADASTTRTYGGTGLGLAISRQLVELMGGEMRLTSEPGEGSTFTFTVPLEREPPTGSRERSAERREVAGLRVLIVDDSGANRAILEEQTHAWGIESTSVAGGAEALGALREAADAGEPFDVALLDWDMPGMDGVELARAIAGEAALRPTRLVLMTSLGRPDAAERVPVAAQLSKPIRRSQLQDCLAEVTGAAVGRPPAVRERPPPGPPSGPRLLVAEDNVVNQKVALAMLAKLGYRADIVSTGVEAVEALAGERYGAILMDCQMPEMDGYAATTAIRWSEAGTERVPIIAMTASAAQGEQEKCLAAGMDDYISKPVAIGDLDAILRRWLDPDGER